MVEFLCAIVVGSSIWGQICFGGSWTVAFWVNVFK
jgi:hypothetical protein